MNHLIVDGSPKLKSPIMLVSFSGWPDAHDAATGAIKYLSSQLHAKKFAAIDPEEFYVFTRTRPQARNNDVGEREMQWPSNEFSYWHDDSTARDLLLFSGVEPQLKWKTYTSAIVDMAVKHRVEMVIVLGSLMDSVPHTRAAKVSGSANVRDIAELLEQDNEAHSGYEGPTGVTTALMEACAKSGIKYASMWGHTPHYLQATPNLRVSLALVERIARVLGLNVSLADLEETCGTYDQRVLRSMVNTVETTSYIQGLEDRYDQAAEVRLDESHSELPSSDAVIEELEAFFREFSPHENVDLDGPDDIAVRG
jgi:proteasome assembly chaperone (PAC2) family protein